MPVYEEREYRPAEPVPDCVVENILDVLRMGGVTCSREGNQIVFVGKDGKVYSWPILPKK